MKLERSIGIAALTVTALGVGAVEAGFRLNFTESAPRGVWIVQAANFDVLLSMRGKLVSACPPAVPVVKMMSDRRLIPQGNCPKTNTIPMFKAVGAIPGDIVTIRNGQNVLVNGEEIPNTIPRYKAYAWPEGEYLVKPFEVWVFSTYTKNSFDSRYFGPVSALDIRGEAFPVVIDGQYNDMRRGIGP